MEEAFLRDIGEHPDDDAPRVAYADWLQEQGDEVQQARGEFIAAQCAVARDEERGVDRDRWKRRQRKLLRKHRSQWLGATEVLVWASEFRRGFLDRLTLHHNHIPQGMLQVLAGELFRREPVVRHLQIHRGHGTDPNDPDRVMHVLRLPQLPRLVTLGLQGNGLGPDAVRDLAASPVLVGLRRLFLGHNPIGTAGILALAVSQHVRQLEALDLSETEVSRVGLGALAGSPHLHQLLFLDLSENAIALEALTDLSHAGGPRSLHALHLRRAGITNQHVETLCYGRLRERLRRLDLSYNDLEDEAVEPLLERRFFPVLNEVRLVGCPISPDLHARMRARFRGGFEW